MKLKVKVVIGSLLCILAITMVYMFFIHTKPEVNSKATHLEYKVNNSYFINNNMEQGLWGFHTINYNYPVQEALLKRKSLSSIKVAILDTGIDFTHPDLKENITQGYDFVNNDDKPIDDNGHGTQIAGIIGGKYTGTAYGVKLMPVKVLDKKGLGKSEALVKGIMWAVDNGADIINLSIGRRKHESIGLSTNGEDSFNDLEHKAIKYALLSNVAVVTVSGDFNISEVGYPASYKYDDLNNHPIVVTGIKQDKEKASMANYSDEIDISAPGEYVLTTMPNALDKGNNDYVNLDNDGYIYCQGTSYAAAYVTGLAAVIKSYRPKFSNKDLRNLIISKSKDIGKKGKDNITGYGIIDFYETLKFLEE